MVIASDIFHFAIIDKILKNIEDMYIPNCRNIACFFPHKILLTCITHVSTPIPNGQNIPFLFLYHNIDS
ncbi:hypothetical protein ACJX0J_015242, partial [Zea mays]